METSEKMFSSLMGRTCTDEELERIFPRAKAELDAHDTENGILKIELNDTNRPDLWSPMGLARLLKNYDNPSPAKYGFFSDKTHTADSEGRELHIGKRAKEVRPFSCGFAADGKKVDEEILKLLIQSQEKLCWNFGRKRRSIAMGIYRNNMIAYPIHYDGADPDKTAFVPLHMEENLTLRQICEKHPKGLEYGYIVKDSPVYPYLYDDNNEPLSFPPVINSARVGAVEPGDDNLFVEMSGTVLKDVLLCASIMACDMADLGFTIRPIKVVYPYKTEFGKEITVPYFFQESASCTLSQVKKILGEDISAQEALDSLRRMGIEARAEKSQIRITCPPYRNDFLHAVDIVEDIMIGYGLEKFEPVIPEDFTVGRLSPQEELSRKIKNILTGMGFQEMMYNYLGSRQEYLDNMCADSSKAVFIANPMTENYEVVRPSVLPSLLKSESISAGAVYPHRIFEIGKTVCRDERENSGTRTDNTLGLLLADPSGAGFNDINSIVNTLMYFLNREYRLNEPPEDEKRFIPGRCAQIICNSQCIGIFGEIHPQILENWGCGTPAVVCEINLDLIL